MIGSHSSDFLLFFHFVVSQLWTAAAYVASSCVGLELVLSLKVLILHSFEDLASFIGHRSKNSAPVLKTQRLFSFSTHSFECFRISRCPLVDGTQTQGPPLDWKYSLLGVGRGRCWALVEKYQALESDFWFKLWLCHFLAV